MQIESGQSSSLWMLHSQLPTLPRLDEDQRTDVCVIGAGITGLSVAYQLIRSGVRVVVLDTRDEVGAGQTCRTTAHLSYWIDDFYQEIERWHGHEGARLAANSHRTAIAVIEEIVRQEQIACQFHYLDGYLFVPPGASREVLDKELTAAHHAGLNAVSLVERAPIATFDTGPALRFPQVAQFDPMAYMRGLCDAILLHGGLVFGDARVLKMEGGAEAFVQTRSGHVVACKSIVVATNTPINNRITLHTKQAPYTTYVIAGRIPRGSVAPALFWDTADPYHYVRLAEGSVNHDSDAASYSHDYLIVGGEDHKTGQENDAQVRFALLEAWARGRFPMLEEVEARWSGQVMETLDGLAFIGRNPGDAPNVYVSTGDSGMGMTHGTIAGLLLRDLILGQANPWRELYSPSRTPVSALGSYLRENLNVVAQYFDYLKGSEVAHISDIPAGEGAVLKKGMAPVAVYRDEAGLVHERSAVCSHMGCVVHWNSAEKSWDCPCHGSRYDALGRVSNGPAIEDLERIHDEAPPPEQERDAAAKPEEEHAPGKERLPRVS